MCDVAPEVVAHHAVVKPERPTVFPSVRRRNEPLALDGTQVLDRERNRNGRLLADVRRDGAGEVRQRKDGPAHHTAFFVEVPLAHIEFTDGMARPRLDYTAARGFRRKAVVAEYPLDLLQRCARIDHVSPPEPRPTALRFACREPRARRRHPRPPRRFPRSHRRPAESPGARRRKRQTGATARGFPRSACPPPRRA